MHEGHKTHSAEGGGPLLFPRPRHLEISDYPAVFANEVRVVRDASLAPEGYRLEMGSSKGVVLFASGPAGEYYGRTTLAQLARSYGGMVPSGCIEDWPDFDTRGVMLDVSRTKVPLIKTLEAMIEVLGSWKINHLELYTEHTFAYTGHREVWQDADPYSADDLAHLARTCRRHHIELVANQNTLGHMERWLLHDRYAALGISQGVVRHPLGLPFPASTLDPANPKSLELVSGLVAELAEACPSKAFHVGLDEPWDLPSKRYREWARWASDLRSLDSLEGREMLVWGDMLASHPDLASLLSEASRPGNEITVCEWGYEANHPFAMRTEQIALAGLSHWVCPGTSSWLSIAGRLSNAVDNCRAAAVGGLANGSKGFLVTDWGDFGHLQQFPIALPGLAAAAAFSWCERSNAELSARDLCRWVAFDALGDSSGHLGDALCELGELFRLVPSQMPNMSTLVAHLYLPQLPVGSMLSAGLSAEHLDAVQERLEVAGRYLAGADSDTTKAKQGAAELRHCAELMGHLVVDARYRLAADGTLGALSDGERAALGERLCALMSQHRSLWLARNRPGGLDESLAWLDHLLDCYRSGSPNVDWAGPLVERPRHQAARQGHQQPTEQLPD